MKMKLRKGTHLYWIKNHPTDVALCPLCNSKLAVCHIGEFCSKKYCPYADGVAWLTKAQVKRFKNKIGVTYSDAMARAAENTKKEFDNSTKRGRMK